MKIIAKIIFEILFIIVIATVFAACGSLLGPVVGTGGEAEVTADGADEPDETAPVFDESSGGGNGRGETGVIVYSDGAMLLICTPDDRNLNFLVEGGEVDKSGARGLAEGSGVDVYYIGVINGNDTSAAQVTKLVQSEEQAKVRVGAGVAGGIALEADGTALKIAAFSGGELTFTVEGREADIYNSDGLAVGDYVTVFYEGEIIDGSAENVKVVRIVG